MKLKTEQLKKSVELKAGSLKWPSKIIPSSKSVKEKKEREKIQISNIRKETDPADIKRIIRDYYEQLSMHKLDNLEEMDQFLEKHNLPQFTQIEVNNLNIPITVKEIEINNFKTPQKDTSRSRWLHWRVLPNVKRKVNTNSTHFLLENNWEGNLSPSFCGGSIILIPKTIQKMKAADQYSSLNSHKQNFNKILANTFSAINFRNYVPWPYDMITLRRQDWFNIRKWINVIHCINSLKRKISWSH